MTINITNNYEYSGVNADACAEVERVCTFKQGIKHYGVPGAAFKGMQKVASLMRMREVENRETGKTEKKPAYFAVFDADEMQSRARLYISAKKQAAKKVA
jgi:hypothetical protein|tara:strand:+ start:181 stop:480 length:300 start_codon:yes stop_codon:yes gene_type:complete